MLPRCVPEIHTWVRWDDPAALRIPVEPPLSLSGDESLDFVVVRSAQNLASDEEASALAALLAERHVRKVWVQCKQDETDEHEGGHLYFPGGSAPVVPGFENGRLLNFAKTLKDRGISVYAWVPAFNDQHAWNEHPGWRSRMADEEGDNVEQHGWLCPRHPGALEYEAGILAETVAHFGESIDGVYTDFIRFDNDYSCVCERCLSEFSKRTGGGMVVSADIRKAESEMGESWEIWSACRGDAIREALDRMRDRLEEVRPDIWFGASVLPFSAVDYSMNTQSGQDLEKMCLAGVDEIVLMGYWDDWGKSTAWLAESISMALEKVEGEARLSVLLDADMSRRTTAATLAAIDGEGTECGWFLYDQWTGGRLDLLHRAMRDRSTTDAAKPSQTTVTIRIDTEPDSEKNYDEVDPDMITKLLDLFRDEGIHATFVTCARLAEQQTEVLRQAERAGHEIAVHAYDHEQIDALPEDEQIAVVDRATQVMRGLGFRPTGFGAPRNSITDAARDRLIERGYFYDGSAAFDPLETYHEPFLDFHDSGDGRAIVVVPFVIPNDWDARFLNGLDPAATLAEWSKRLEKMASEKQPCFVLDVHQWSASRTEDLEVLRQFIRLAKARPDCRFATLHEAAEHALDYLREGEAPALRP